MLLLRIRSALRGWRASARIAARREKDQAAESDSSKAFAAAVSRSHRRTRMRAVRVRLPIGSGRHRRQTQGRLLPRFGEAVAALDQDQESKLFPGGRASGTLRGTRTRENGNFPL